MNQFTERPYQALLGYLKEELADHRLQVGSLLPSDSQLSARLSFSVPSIRESLHLLEMFGLLSPAEDGQYRVSHDVSRGFTDILSLMLLTDQLRYADVVRLRRSITLQSLPAICKEITESQKQNLYLCLVRMMASEHGDLKADMEFHDTLLAASGDQLALSLNRALNQFMRGEKKTEYYFENWEALVQIHVQLYRGVVDGDVEAAAKAVNDHFDLLAAHTYD